MKSVDEGTGAIIEVTLKRDEDEVIVTVRENEIIGKRLQATLERMLGTTHAYMAHLFLGDIDLDLEVLRFFASVYLFNDSLMGPLNVYVMTGKLHHEWSPRRLYDLCQEGWRWPSRASQTTDLFRTSGRVHVQCRH